ncbi:MAG: elongation factor G [Saprospiraceae bacterium]|jgi:elongation factor G
MAFDTKNIRNVVLLGHSGSGKTTLAEAMLFEAGALSRRGTVEDGSTVSDYTNIEKERGNSIFGSLMNAKWKDSKINLMDTPGSDDFVGEVASALKVADTAVMVINGRSGVEVGTELLWEYIEKIGTPAIFVINQMGHKKANFENALAQAQARFGSKLVPVQYPLNAGQGFNKIVDALRMVVYNFPIGGGKPTKEDIPASEKERALEMHNALVEAAAEADEELMERFFEEGTLREEDLASGLRQAIVNRSFCPVFCASGLENMGSGRVMGFINDVCPSPADRPAAATADGGELACKTEGDSTVFIYKTVSEPRVGSVSYFKVYSGILRGGDELMNNVSRTAERFGSIFTANGKNRDTIDNLRAGDLGVTVKLKASKTNETLVTKGSLVSIKKIPFPEPRIRAAVDPPSKNDMEKLMKALHQIEGEDPTLIIEQSKSLKQTIVHGQGQLHLDLIKYRIEKVNNLVMNYMKPNISYRETITKMAEGSYRHKKQSGGSGQFAEVHMRIEPYYEGMPEPTGLNVRKTEEEALSWGGKLVYYWCIIGGSIDGNFSNAIKKGILQKMEEGPLTGSYCQDIRVCIFDGKMHPVDSNDMAFMLASSAIFKDNFERAAPKIMEPIYDVEILCDGEVMGDIMGDLQTRRAIIQGMDSEGHYQKIMAKVPLAEMYQYSSKLRSLSQGKAKFSRRFGEYSSVAKDVQKELVRDYQGTQEE